ncbi:ATP-binding protein [Fulvivirga maritima]|uniref:sensor histidine kinase n=1 Tax=Fulvivirga maritima TaxID=2904247 RepID=UPI001F24975E|nr:7TM diverse intracellular signaling domain-containing protein [Fulvivirga maritima]UII28249.1 ATP-binding protein [Fulvivirga maritima]
MRYICLALIFLCLAQGISSAQDVLEIQGLRKKSNLNSYFDYLVDQNNNLDIDEVVSLDSTAWSHMDNKGLRKGIGNQTIWLKLQVVGLVYDPEQLAIEFYDQSIQQIELFEIRESGRTSHSSTGSCIDPNEKSIPGNHNSFMILVDPLQSTDYYFKITSPNSITITATIEDDAQALSKNTNERTYLGLFYGALIILMLYNILLFISTKFNVFLYYAIYILSVSLSTAYTDGFNSLFLFPLVDFCNGYLNVITTSTTLILGLFFMMDFLNIGSWSPKISNFTKWFIGTIAGITFICLITYPPSAFTATAILSLIVLPFMLIIGLLGIKLNIPQAGYFFTACLIFAVFVFLLNLYLLQVFDFGFIPKYAIHIGFISSTLILSYGLGVRIYKIYQTLIREEKNKQMMVEQKNKELEEKVRERTTDIVKKEVNLRSILDNSDNSIWLIDENYKLIDYNTVFAQSWQISYGNTLSRGSNLLELFPNDNNLKKTWKKRFDDILSGQRAVYRDIVNEETDTENRNYFEIYAYPIEERGKITGASFFLKDISERVNAEEQLLAQNDMLKKVNKELDSFVYSASHDLKAPLASVMGLINLVKYETEVENRQAYYEMMSNSISRLNQSIKDIIDFSRNARLDIDYEVVDIKKMLSNIFDDLQYIEGADQIIRCEDIEHGLIIKTDPTRLRVILRNLVSNAIHYGCVESDDKRIEIKVLKNKSDMVELSIRDFGPGIPESYHQRIFDMFYRANESSSGTGLGLYIVKETVDKLSGKIRMNSEEGKGSIFTVEIPYI